MACAFNVLFTAWRERSAASGGMEPGLKRRPHTVAPFKTGVPSMKSLIALTAIAAFTVTTAVAGKPGAFATDKAIATAKSATAKSAAAKSKPVMMAEQQLPFDRERSKN